MWPVGPLWQRSFFRQSLFHVCRYSLKDAFIIITFYIFFVYEVSVWAGREREQERKRETASWHIHGYQKTMPGVSLSSTWLERRSHSCCRYQATWPTVPQDPLISASHLTVRGMRWQTCITRSKLHMGSGDLNSGPHTCAGNTLSAATQLKLGNLERLTHEQECMYTSHVKVPQPCLCWEISKLDSSSNWKLVSDLYLSNLV